MGIGGYVKARNDVEMFVGNSMVFKENFVNKFLGNSSCYYKDFEDGLKDFVHLIDELDSIKLREALIKLVQMQKEYDGDKYRIGTVVMRALHFLGTFKILNIFINFFIYYIFTKSNKVHVSV